MEQYLDPVLAVITRLAASQDPLLGWLLKHHHPLTIKLTRLLLLCAGDRDRPGRDCAQLVSRAEHGALTSRRLDAGSWRAADTRRRAWAG